MTFSFAQIVQGMVGPALLAVFGACAKYLRDIARDVNAMKVTMGVASERLDDHGRRLTAHDERLRELEGAQRAYVS